jgi:hypothetical protein
MTFPEPPSCSVAGPDVTTLCPFRIGLDWLSISVTGPTRLLHYDRPQRWRARWGEVLYWVPMGKRTAVFDAIYTLQDDRGEKLLTVTGLPRAGMFSGRPDWMQIQFSNRTLYSGEFVRLWDQMREMGFLYMSISRMDIAADGIAGNGGDFLEPIQRTWGGGVDYYGKAGWTPRFQRKTVTGAELGSRASNKFLRCYNKTRELKQAHNVAKRAYIEQAWSDALGESPHDNGREVNRLELQVKGTEVRRYFAQEGTPGFVASLADGAALVDMFASMVPKVFDFRIPAERARDAVPVVAWDFGAVSTSVFTGERAKKTVAMSPHTLKILIRQMFVLGVATGDQSWRVKADELAHAGNLHHWMTDAVKRWTTAARVLRVRGGQYTNDLFDQLTL